MLPGFSAQKLKLKISSGNSAQARIFLIILFIPEFKRIVSRIFAIWYHWKAKNIPHLLYVSHF
jgi:hypothetical protein